MTWRSVISFSLLVQLLPAATVRGKVVLKNPARTQNSDRETVLWLEPAAGENAVSRRPHHAEILQKNKTFQPHLLTIPAGSSVSFPNIDPLFHNAFSNYDGQVFDIGLYPPGSTRTVTFNREGIVRVFCNIHSTMSAVIVVLRSPYFTQTGSDGQFEFDGMPEGRYRMKLYHERATEETLKALERDVEIAGAALDLGTLELTESGYLPVRHLNKYGKPYSAAADAATYPGARH